MTKHLLTLAFFGFWASAFFAQKSPDPPAHECNCPKPSFIKRNIWCLDPPCPQSAAPMPTNVVHMVVHHSAGPSVAADWRAVVTAIWQHDVEVLGLADIGFNWLIAPDGTLFEGRLDNITGQHFCDADAGTMGVCLLGNFADSTISEAARKTLIDVLAWKTCQRNVDPHDPYFHAPSGQLLPVVCGHRDGCATDCPGAAFYAELPALRDSVLLRLSACSQVGLGDEKGDFAGSRLFPNPAENGVFWIEMPEKAAFSKPFSLLDAKGATVETAIFYEPNRLLVEVKSPARGLFFWRLGGRAGRIFLD